MQDNAGKFYVFNGKLIPSVNMDYDDIKNSPVYEVIRIIRGVPLFFEDHMERMAASLTALNINQTLATESIKSDIKKLLETESNDNCNVKIMVDIVDGIPTPITYISKSYYPPEEVIKEGVRTGLLKLERDNPNAKVFNSSYKKTVAEKIEQGNFFELLLVNKDNIVTEGSRSNVFFVQGDEIYTTPGELVLLGVTRKYVFQACKNAGYKVKEDYIDLDCINNIDALFLSGTSIKVLPVLSVDDKKFDSSKNQVVGAVAREYDTIIEKYLNNADW